MSSILGDMKDTMVEQASMLSQALTAAARVAEAASVMLQNQAQANAAAQQVAAQQAAQQQVVDQQASIL